MGVQQYDVYLDGVGYHLAKGQDGRLLAGSARERRADPWASYSSQGERWKRATFRMGDGAGVLEYDGSHRYRRGWSIDTRGGRLIRMPDMTFCEGASSTVLQMDADDRDDATDEDISSLLGDNDGMAVKFTAASTSIRTVGVLVRRVAGYNWSAAGDFYVELRRTRATARARWWGPPSWPWIRKRWTTRGGRGTTPGTTATISG